MNRSRAGFLFVFTFGVLLTPSLGAQGLDPQRIPRTPLPILVSASGGISKGSYQAGLDYVINEFVRRQTSTAFRTQVWPDTVGRPDYYLASATGASAGNVNAVIAAYSWCTARVGNSVAIAPEASPFWRVWVNTGVTELLPDADPLWDLKREGAVFDRKFFQDVQREVLRQFSDSATPRDPCSVPLGITMTRQIPITVHTQANEITAEVQRFAAVQEIRTDKGDGKSWIDVRASAHFDSSGSLGVLVRLPELQSSAEVTKEARLNALFHAIVASSSFPIAFAPKELCYYSGGLAPHPVGQKPDCRNFVDGGAFDNNPVALAVRLFELNEKKNAFSDVRSRVAFTNPGVFRGLLDQTRGRDTRAIVQQDGISALIQVGGGMWSSAREYELQSLLRLWQREKENGIRSQKKQELPTTGLNPGLDVWRSSRSSPIFGEYLMSFAAFLGHPLREFDFYTGLYDGLHFVARYFVCEDRDQPTCTDRALERLIEDNIFGFGNVARQVIHWQHLAESKAPVPVDVPRLTDSSSTDSLRLVLLATLHNNMLRLRRGDPREPCASGDIVAGQLCSSGLGILFEELSGDRVFRAAADRLCKHCDSLPQLARERGECFVDQAFIDFIADPKRYLHSLVTRVISNLDDVEARILRTKPELSQYSAFAELVYLFYRSSDLSYRRGFEVNPSSAVWDRRGGRRLAESIAGRVAPNYVVIYARGVDDREASPLPKTRPGAVTFGWHPIAAHLGWGMLAASAEVSRFVDVANDTKHYSFSPGLSLMPRTLTPGFLNSLEVGALYSQHLFRRESDSKDRDWVVQVTKRLAFDKLRLTAKFVGDDAWTLGLGIGDLNGMLYWLAR